MSGKYQMTLTGQQIMLIANCVEDCHRFACGETELWNTVASMNGHGELRAKEEIHHIMMTSYRLEEATADIE